jgi:hypothetical protein
VTNDNDGRKQRSTDEEFHEQTRRGDNPMNTITVKDGTQIFFKEWGTGHPVVFSHGWPLSADAFEDQMFFLASRGYRCIAHDRRGHGRSSQPWNGNNLDTYADDLAELVDRLGLKDAIHVGHSTGGGEVARYIGRYGTKRVAKAVLIGAIPPVMLKTPANPLGLARRVFPGQVPTRLVSPEPYEHETFTLESHELRIIQQGRTDCPDSTSLYIPSIGLIVAGDVVYNQCRIYVGDTTPESRENWIAALDRLAALDPAIVVAGHKKTGAPDSPSTIQDTKRYLQDFDRLQKTATSDRELFDQMTELYPRWVANQSWLMFGFPQE